MTKVALIVLGFIVFGLLKLVASDRPHTQENDLQLVEDVPENNEQERFGSKPQGVGFAGSMAQPRPHPLPIPNSPLAIHLTECYVCTDCPKVLFNTTSKLCPYTLDPLKRGKCVVYAEQYKHMKRLWYIRGCVSERGTCADIKKAHSTHADIVNLVSCTECEGDRCNVNGASRSITDITMALFAMVVTPLIAKYTLS